MAVGALERRPATWEEYQSLGEDVRAEYIDGEIVMTPFPTLGHQQACRRLANLVEANLPGGFEVVEAYGWKPGEDEFGPDVMVFPTAESTSDVRFTGTPVLCIEVVSGNRGIDYVTKAAKYAMAGLVHYWILDPAGTLDVLTLDETGHYLLEAEVRVGQSQDVSFGIATVHIDLATILR